jgi:hypothetical protein
VGELGEGLRASRRGEPGWVLALVGWLAMETALDCSRAREPIAAAAPERAVDWRTSPPRELRKLPGIGVARALAIARMRFERGADGFRLDEVPGIGPATVRNVECFIDGGDAESRGLDDGDPDGELEDGDGDPSLQRAVDGVADPPRRSGAEASTLHSCAQQLGIDTPNHPR